MGKYLEEMHSDSKSELDQLLASGDGEEAADADTTNAAKWEVDGVSAAGEEAPSDAATGMEEPVTTAAEATVEAQDSDVDDALVAATVAAEVEKAKADAVARLQLVANEEEETKATVVEKEDVLEKTDANAASLDDEEAKAAALDDEKTKARAAANLAAMEEEKAKAADLAAKETKAKAKAKQFTTEEALVVYEDMYLGRSFEDMCAQMYYRGKMFGFVHLYNGQEAVSSGIISQLRKDDYICSTYRDHVHALSKGVSARKVMAELFGKSTGVCRGQGGSMHMFDKEHNMVRALPVISFACSVNLYSNLIQIPCCHCLG